MARVYYTVECVKYHHFRVDADCPDARGRIEKVWNPLCPYCGIAMFRRWWRSEYPENKDAQS